MTQLHLRRWNGQFRSQGVISQIRREMRGRIKYGECLVVYEERAEGLTADLRRQLRRGWPQDKVRFSLLHPTGEKK